MPCCLCTNPHASDRHEEGCHAWYDVSLMVKSLRRHLHTCCFSRSNAQLGVCAAVSLDLCTSKLVVLTASSPCHLVHASKALLGEVRQAAVMSFQRVMRVAQPLGNILSFEGDFTTYMSILSWADFVICSAEEDYVDICLGCLVIKVLCRSAFHHLAQHYMLPFEGCKEHIVLV